MNTQRFPMIRTLLSVGIALLFIACQEDKKESTGPDNDGDGVPARFDCDDADPLVQEQEDGCQPGFSCTRADDCSEGVCALAQLVIGDGIGAGICAEPTCSDGVLNAFESDIDCGDLTAEGCPPCGFNKDLADFPSFLPRPMTAAMRDNFAEP